MPVTPHHACPAAECQQPGESRAHSRWVLKQARASGELARRLVAERDTPMCEPRTCTKRGRAVDLFQGPAGVEAWAYAAPTKKNLMAYTTTTIRAARAAHPCSPPQTGQAITIGGAPARLLGMQCPAGSGFLVELAVTVRHGTAYVFASQNPTGTKPADPAAFRKFLAGIRLQR